MKKISIILIIAVIIISSGFIYLNSKKVTNTQPIPNQETMDLVIFFQDKEIAKISDCGVTYKTVQQVPKTTGVLDASLKILFQQELFQYGQYDSVKIKDGVAQVMLKNDLTQKGYPISSLSSCEIQHLTAVLKDTLTQYSGVLSVELFSPRGKIEF